jgi:2-polyprenyl-3-methyl-5-hydroxy-6-metoxy-1,4-benzoquinol methylase
MQYNPPIDLTDDNTTPHTRMIQLVGRNKTVLDVGCARGNTGRVLVNQFNCIVSGIEKDPQAADCARDVYQQVIVGDIENIATLTQVRGGPFDIIIFADVLEHLQQPERVLSASRSLLQPEGYVLISLPNIVTLRLRIRFLLGRFEYTEQGIMDKTHLRFFTFKTAREMIAASGYSIEHFEFLVGHRFGRRLARLRIPRRWLPPTVFGTQFIFKARPVRS